MCSRKQARIISKCYVRTNNKEHLILWCETHLQNKDASRLINRLITLHQGSGEELWDKEVEWARGELKKLGYVQPEYSLAQ